MASLTYVGQWSDWAMCVTFQPASVGLLIRRWLNSSRNARSLQLRLGTSKVTRLLKSEPKQVTWPNPDSRVEELDSTFCGRGWKVTFPRTDIHRKGGEFRLCVFVCCCFHFSQSKTGGVNNTRVPLHHHFYHFFNLKNCFWEALKISSLGLLGIFL